MQCGIVLASILDREYYDIDYLLFYCEVTMKIARFASGVAAAAALLGATTAANADTRPSVVRISAPQGSVSTARASSATAKSNGVIAPAVLPFVIAAAVAAAVTAVVVVADDGDEANSPS